MLNSYAKSRLNTVKTFSTGFNRISLSGEVISLGVVLQNTLSWKSQIASISRKVNRALFGLRFIRACTTQALRKTLVETLVVPHLDYCSVVYLDLPFCLKIQLQRLANRAVRYVFNLRMNTRVTPYRCQLGWLRTDTRREYFMGLTMYKLMQLRQPNYLLQLFTRYESSRPSRGLRKDLRIPHVTSEMGRTSFQVQSANLWNSLPVALRDLPSLTRFKREFRKHLLNNEI